MTANADDSRSRQTKLQQLVSAATALPPGEREAFLRANAPDETLAAEAMALLRSTTNDDATLVGDASGGRERVQSTATGELLAKLGKAPKLDVDRFALETEVGKGGMGAVLRIHDRLLNRRVAMKVLLERAAPRDDDEKRLANQLLGRFLEEAQVTSQLDHPGVVPVHELGLDATGKVYFTMRLVKGRTASDVFADAFAGHEQWPLTRALEVVLKVCDTMAYAHDKGVLHRDLKPSNVMVGRFGEVYVMDWGLAKVLGQTDRHDLRIAKDPGTGASKIESARRRDAETDTASSVVSMDGQQLGTPSYMPPEQARSEELDVRADVYAIGAMMYELLTGRAPYVTPGVRQPAYRILNDVVEGPPKRIEDVRKGVPAELVAIVEKAMARDRGERFASVTELSNDLRAFLAQRVVKAYRTGALVEMNLWVRRNKALAASLAATALILVLGLVGTSTYASDANAAREEAEEQKIFVEGKVAQFNQLSLVVDLERLLETEPELTPGAPEQVALIEDWLERATFLLQKKADASAVVRSLQRSAGSWSVTYRDGVVVGATTGDAASLAAERFLERSLRDLLERLPDLEKLVPDMARRGRWAKSVGPLTLAHPNAKHTWAEARAAIARADGVVANELYKGQDIPLRDEDVWGLVPIGMNPQSKLWEFYDLRSAWDGVQDPATLPIPTHEPDGRIKVTGDTGIVFVLLPGGTLPQGTPADDEGAKKRLTVRLDPFFLGKYEVTQGQWVRWTDENPSDSKTRNDLALPVERVSWLDAEPVLRAHGLTLPSELQWEYGVRAGTTTNWWTGDDRAAIEAAEGVNHNQVLPVGSWRANGRGLFDMGGSLWEWCLDEHSDYGPERVGDGRRPDPAGGSVSRCVRGGCWDGDPVMAESGTRGQFSPALRHSRLGLRAARTSRL